MKKLALFALAFAFTAAHAADVVLPQPPPYGAYFWLPFGSEDKKQREDAETAIAKHYGYDNASVAYKACLQTGNQYCSADFVAHKRDESPEIARYGFKNWRDAVAACHKHWKNEFGPVNGKSINLKGTPIRVTHCNADPFVSLRMGRK